jgi:hypothetical protein
VSCALCQVVGCTCCGCRSAEEVRKNIECNALSAVDVTHHFLKRMVSPTRLCLAGRLHYCIQSVSLVGVKGGVFRSDR